jgi:chemotaxis protein MotB
MVSYADFMTLLFAFFVVMYASSQSDKARAAQVSESVRQAFDRPSVAAILGGTVNGKGPGNAMMKGPGGAEKTSQSKEGVFAELLPSQEFLEKELRREIAAGKMQVRLEARGLVVSLREAAFFPSGEETLLPHAYPSLEKVAEAVGKLPNPVRLEGHTDSIPIHNERFRSNWELSAHRAIAMLEFFTIRLKFPPNRFAVAGYADTVPVDTNNTEEGRARNRRVDIVILSKAGLSGEPVKK